MAPRNQATANPSLRNRNRVTNKTRLKVIKENIDADPFVLDEDEERARVVSTHGVDAEDANEHHLQAVLSAASHRATALAQKAISTNGSRSDKTSTSTTPAAFIPVPDATGVVENVDELYPSNKWRDPATYVKFSLTVEESTTNAINDGFSYFMDERDVEWLDKNNQEARGEGTSTQASAVATTTRGSRSTKGKGKELETPSPILMTEDEFELVMGLFEKVTHDNTPFLHLAFQQQQANSIPPFSDYHDIFANELSISHFAGYSRSPSLPSPPNLLRIARLVYPYWKERKIDREGNRIIPSLNFDESDTKNESYICFRRRDIKAIRKTRTAQVSSSDKLLRLKSELAQAFQLAENVLTREVNKKEAQNEARNLWDKRMALVDLKRKCPSLGGREDEELLFDKERVPPPPKRRPNESVSITLPGGRPRAKGDPSASPTPIEPMTRPKDRLASIQQAMRVYLDKAKELDIGWDNQIDSPYQQFPVPLADKIFKNLRPESTEERLRRPHCFRLRRGRGGRLHIDRRLPPSPKTLLLGLSTLNIDPKKSTSNGRSKDKETSESSTEKKESMLEKDGQIRLQERWRFDTTSDITGTEEEDRVLIDDFDAKHARIQYQLLHDYGALLTDTRLYICDPNTGNYSFVNPQMVHQDSRSRLEPALQPPRSCPPSQPTVQTQVPATQPTPVAISAPLQSPVKMITPASTNHTHTPTVGSQRSPTSSSPQAATIQSSPQGSANHTSLMNGVPTQTNNINGNSNGAASMPNSTVNGVGVGNGSANNGISNTVPLANASTNLTPAQVTLMQKKQYHQSLRNQAYAQQALLNSVGDVNVLTANFANGVNNPLSSMNLALKTPQRQIPYSVQVQRTQSGQGMNDINVDAATLQNLQNVQAQLRAGTLPNMQQYQLLQASAMNGHHHGHSPSRNAHSPPNSFTHAHSLSPHMGGGSPAQAHSQISQSHMSPTRNMQTPVPPSPSPLLSHQLPNLVGNLSTQSQGF